MRNIIINTIYTALRWYVSTGAFDRIASLVTDLISESIPGEQKKGRVVEFAKLEFGTVWAEMNAIAIDAIIAITRLKHEST